MTTGRWYPDREMVGLRDAVHSLLQESFARPDGAPPGRGAAPFALLLDVTEAEDDFVVRASLPGIKPDAVQATVVGDTVTIRGDSGVEEGNGHTWLLRERCSGTFQRSVSLGTPLDADLASARFEDGVLTLTLPKSARARPKRIPLGQPPLGLPHLPDAGHLDEPVVGRPADLRRGLAQPPPRRPDLGPAWAEEVGGRRDLPDHPADEAGRAGQGREAAEIHAAASGPPQGLLI